MRIEPDGMVGAIIASESLGLTNTMINGAGGCRSRAQIMMHDLIPSYYPENQKCCRSKYFSRQSRLPCTYLNNDDIIFGTAVKVADGIESVTRVTGKRTLLLDTLGASLICTDYSGLTGSEETDPIFIQSDLSGMSISEGYDTVVSAILSSVKMEEGKDHSVNLLGYGLMDVGWEAGADELCSLLEAMGIRVNCVLGCIPSKEEVLSLPKAELNVLVHPEYSIRTAEMLKERYGTEYLRPSKGAPVGYPALRSFVKEVAERMGTDPAPALKIIDKDAEFVHRRLMNFDRMPFGLHSKGFVIEGDSSVAYPLTVWMMETFGMSPRHIKVTDEEYLPEIREYLDSCGFSDALMGIPGDVELYFVDGMKALQGRYESTTAGYVEIRIPRGRFFDLLDRTLVGTKGCRYILDEVFNGIRRFRCGQPTEVEYRPGYKEE